MASGASMPRAIRPMKAVLAAHLPEGEGWSFEIKWDGIRAIGFIEAGSLRLQSSNLHDITPRFPELASLATELAGHDTIVDGEIVAFNRFGVPDFGLLQRRIHISNEHAIADWVQRLPIVYVLFDLLWLDGNDLTQLPYENRRSLLEELIQPGSNWQVPPAHPGNGRELLDLATARSLEGVVAKRRESPYEPGRRSPAWRKIKVRRQQEFVVGGWIPGRGGHANHIGSLLLGYFDGPHLRFAGKVGTGFTRAELERLARVLAPLESADCPFEPPPSPQASVRAAHWVRPELVVQVAYSEWSHEGHLRHPSYLGQRYDKDAREVMREEPVV
ncbi:MAG: non-homologous end-joining DNA ligase [Acidimicrobiales bacterium]|nr:non-homologous end-joining DNA ligase [Acidimicrobiales bacterium]